MNIAFIGFGRRGKSVYGALRKMNVVDNVGFFDTNSDNFTLAQEKNSQSAEELLQQLKTDLVIITTPPSTHVNYIKMCSEKNLSVLCEKPIVSSSEQIKDIPLASKIYVAYQLNFDPLVKKAFVLARGRKIFSIEASQRVFLQPMGWRFDKTISGGGTLLDNASHFIYLAISYFGLPDDFFAVLSSNQEKIEKQCDLTLFYKEFTFKIHSDWLSSVGKVNQINIYTDKYDIHFQESNRSAELFFSSAQNTSQETRITRTNIYPPRGVDRDLRRDPFNQAANESATENMLRVVLNDIKKSKSKFHSSQIDTAIKTSELIEQIYQSDSRTVWL